MNITDRGPNTVTIAFSANELLFIVNALQGGLDDPDPEAADSCRRIQKPLVEALRHLRPKVGLTDGRWTTDWARGDDGKHL